MNIALTGITGNMGGEALVEVLKINTIEKIKVLILPKDPLYKRIGKVLKKNKERIEIIYGNLKDYETCLTLVKDTSYVVNMAAVIPPKSDKGPQKAFDCNVTGVKNLVKAIESLEKQPKLIHTSTVALYGNRTGKHPYGIVGDPLLVSPFDVYSVTKLRGEIAVIESNIKYWAVIRQSAMLHKYMLTDNISDGLMFHTCFNSPLEWVTSHDSGVLVANIIKKDLEEDISKSFWKRIFNIGAPKENRVTGFTTLDDGFKLIGGSTKNFFKPNFNATRNFHGMWFYDGAKLDDLFHYQKETTSDYWSMIAKTHKYYALAKPLPSSLISKLVIQRLFKDNNSIKYWYNHKDEARMFATFGGMKAYEEIGTDWNTFHLLEEGKNPDGTTLNYEELRDITKTKLMDYGFDSNKDLSLITEEDLLNIASMHGGKLISKFNGDLYESLHWVNQDGEEFVMRPYSVIAGHWENVTYHKLAWDFDRLAKKDKIYAQIWYESHKEDENKYYYMDDQFNAFMEEI